MNVEPPKTNKPFFNLGSRILPSCEIKILYHTGTFEANFFQVTQWDFLNQFVSVAKIKAIHSWYQGTFLSNSRS